MTLHHITAMILPELYFLAGLLAGIVQGVLSAFQVPNGVTPEGKLPAPAQKMPSQIAANSSSKGVVPIPTTAAPATPEPQQPSQGPKATTTPPNHKTHSSAADTTKPALAGAGEATTAGDADIDGALQAMWFGSTPEGVTSRAR